MGAPQGVRFVVSGPGHSGTGFTAKVLTAAGIPCGHEAIFGPRGVRPSWPADLLGDSSWCAAGFLGSVTCPVFLQVRDPIKVVASLVNTPFGKGSAPGTPWTALRRNIGGSPTGDLLVDVVKQVVLITERVYNEANHWWRVEDMGVDDIAAVAEVAGVRPRNSLEAISRTSPATNKHAPAVIGWGDLPGSPWVDRLADQAEHFGYQAGL